jgi:two-component system CheB/CheR fusion protein
MVEGHSIYEAADGTFDIPQLRQLIEDKLTRETRVHDFELVNEFPTVGLKKLLVNACGIPVNSKQVDMVLLAFEDVTELTEAKKALSQTGDLHIANDELQKEIEKLRGAVEVHLQGREAAESQLKKITNELQAANNRLEKSAAERKQAEEEVRSLEELIDTVFQSIQERLVSCGRDFNIASRNKAE